MRILSVLLMLHDMHAPVEHLGWDLAQSIERLPEALGLQDRTSSTDLSLGFFLFPPLSHNRYTKVRGMYYPVYDIVYIKYHLPSIV